MSGRYWIDEVSFAVRMPPDRTWCLAACDATGRVHACRACGGRGLIVASVHTYQAPTDEQLAAMTGPRIAAILDDAGFFGDTVAEADA